jgi:hypothetical protein
MKLLTAFVTLIIATTSYAQTKPAPPQFPPPATYGRGSAKVSIVKSKFVKEGDNYKQVKEKVCEKTVIFDIYDVRNDGGAHRWETTDITCNTLVNGVQTSAAVYLMALVGKSQSDDPIKSDIFSISMGFYLVTPRTSNIFQANMATREIDTKSLMATLGASHDMNCDPNSNICTPIENKEVVNASIEYLGQ